MEKSAVAGATAALAFLSDLAQNGVTANRLRVGPMKSATAYVVRKGLRHGMSGRVLRFTPSVVADAAGGAASVGGYHAVVALGQHLGKMSPSQRVLALRNLKVHLGKSTYLKKAPYTGDMYEALKRIPEHELLQAHSMPTLLTRDIGKGVPDAGKVSMLARGALLGSLGATNKAVVTVVPRAIRETSRAFMTPGTMTSNFVRGMAGQKVSSGSKMQRYLLGTFEAEAQELGLAFRKEHALNPDVAKLVYQDMVDVAAAGTPASLKGKVAVGVARHINPKDWQAVAEVSASSPKVLQQLEKQPKPMELGRMLAAVRVRRKLGLPNGTDMPSFGQIVGSMFGGGKA